MGHSLQPRDGQLLHRTPALSKKVAREGGAPERASCWLTSLALLL
eukprot:CAMPEP_0184398428 /NCGR_PEP_ID=MMETSP0007-20130409/65598_1 /TAXON_ID=97485 /ORGANISM="Prymnesium parvum, Strain Texoma1" /LENGTH=44 /DNA_ID= /DNA_START= /DNA_END= /DNA_ORIENTATION=